MDLNESLIRRRIHADEDCYEVMYLSIKFGVSIEQLIEAITKAGPW